MDSVLRPAIYSSRYAFIALIITIMGAGAAYALSFNIGTVGMSCNVIPDSFAVKVVYCVKMAVFLTTELFLAEVSGLLFPVTLAVGLLTLSILGARIATGERDPQKMVFAFLLKFGIVLLLADNFGAAMGGLTDDVFGITEELQAFSIATLYNSGTCTTGASGLGGSYIIPITFTPWEHIDCIFDYIFGFGAEATIASSLFGFLGSTFFSGTVGSMIFFLGIALVLSILFFAFRVVYVTMIAYVYIGFLIVISPLIFPTLLFKVTERSFFKWMFNLLGGISQPFFMVSYLGFTMPILDDFVFGPGDQALVQTLGRGADVTDTYRLATQACEVRTATDFDFNTLAGAGLNLDLTLENFLNPLDSGAMDWCGMFEFTEVDYGEEHIQELWEIGMSLIRILAVCALMLSIAKFIPEVVGFMIGGYSFASATQKPMLFESRIRSAVSNQFKPEGAGFKQGGRGFASSMLGLGS